MRETFDILYSPAISYLQLWHYLSRVHKTWICSLSTLIKTKIFTNIFYILLFWSLYLFSRKKVLILHILYIFSFLFFIFLKLQDGTWSYEMQILVNVTWNQDVWYYFNCREMCNFLWILWVVMRDFIRVYSINMYIIMIKRDFCLQWILIACKTYMLFDSLYFEIISP